MSTMLIFGGSGAIGSSIAIVAKRLGFSVVSADIKKPQRDISGVHYISADATEEADVKRAISYTSDKHGVIDVLVNCQGIYAVNKLEETDSDKWDDLFNVNAKSVFLTCKNIIPIMKWQRRGYIINIASMAGLRGKAGESVYCASKFAVVGLTYALSEELKETGVRVTAVCPSSVDTPLLNNEIRLKKEELDKILQPEDIAKIVGELISSHKRVHRTIVPIEIEIEIEKLGKKRR